LIVVGLKVDSDTYEEMILPKLFLSKTNLAFLGFGKMNEVLISIFGTGLLVLVVSFPKSIL